MMLLLQALYGDFMMLLLQALYGDKNVTGTDLPRYKMAAINKVRYTSIPCPVHSDSTNQRLNTETGYQP
jgi:hypothetical protein